MESDRKYKMVCSPHFYTDNNIENNKRVSTVKTF